ncbi:AT-rich interactive domain-containing protein 2 [Phtheirospermum japonicum]|uniref:AT-rich interactive domain-containing protein 2 n=1 Tax=Phtheirospermum japonicum TaxID=374723 RepID=A0A830BQR1_9LAMI|nr:AT-rich interactive domain-containing protein 2 [Phtheirospermum japonicum]
MSNFYELQYDEPLVDSAYVADKELDTSLPLSLVTSTSSEEDSGDGPTSFWPYIPGNEFTLPRQPPEQFQNPYVSLLNGPPRKEIPLGPDHQAKISTWGPNNGFSRSYYVSDNGRDQEKMGTCIIPMPDVNDSTVDGFKAGRGRKTDCSCLDVGSTRCVQQHVKEAREKLRESIGNDNFVKLGFDGMGEAVARDWARDDERAFHDIVVSNPVVFWKHLRAEFPGREMKELVSYYFNVFMLRRRAVQNRSFVLEIDSDDDDEEQKGPDEELYRNGPSYSVDRDTYDNINNEPRGHFGEFYLVGRDDHDDDDDSTVESFGDEDLDCSWVDEFWSEPEKVNGDNKQNNDKITGQDNEKVNDKPGL